MNERMLATKRGREYARQIPLDRLLLETDAPAEPKHRNKRAVAHQIARKDLDAHRLTQKL